MNVLPITCLRLHDEGVLFSPVQVAGRWQLQSQQGHIMTGARENPYDFASQSNALLWLRSNMLRLAHGQNTAESHITRLAVIHSETQSPAVAVELDNIITRNAGEWNVSPPVEYMQGGQGPQGPAGPEGPQGPQGPQGLPGVAVGGGNMVAWVNRSDLIVSGQAVFSFVAQVGRVYKMSVRWNSKRVTGESTNSKTHYMGIYSAGVMLYAAFAGGINAVTMNAYLTVSMSPNTNSPVNFLTEFFFEADGAVELKMNNFRLPSGAFVLVDEYEV